uniref:Uncharacterized protein n=1 Tax=Ophiocordyceps sinensis TaxID=72228 RepID=A0A1X8VJM6_9HYPO|nr:hypothetical protein [Ophiocordyceps sinensis]ARF03403.1 hypothetical protein [Ophiocordyceps sinensis]QDH07216.1 hypothetical protein [Ophiocordyceps sinensis]
MPSNAFTLPTTRILQYKTKQTIQNKTKQNKTKKHMTFITTLFNTSNTVVSRREISFLFNRIAIIILISCSLNDLLSLTVFTKAFGIHGDLLLVTRQNPSLTQTQTQIVFSSSPTYKRFFSTLTTNKKTNPNINGTKSNRSNILTNILNNLLLKSSNNKYLANSTTQLDIEKLVFEQYKLHSYDSTRATVSGINLDLLTPKLRKFIFSKQENLFSCVDNYSFYLNDGKLKKDEDIFKEVVNCLPSHNIVNICLYYFLQICTYQSTDDIDQFKVSRLAINMGSECIKLYLLRKKYEYELDNFVAEKEKTKVEEINLDNTTKVIFQKMKYSLWHSHFTNTHPELSTALNDQKIIF